MFVRPRDGSLLAKRPLLDIGCGDGQNVLAAAGADAIGIDRSLEVLRAARQSGLTRIAAANADALPFRVSSFEVVLAADLFHHVDDLRPVMDEIRSVLRPGGLLVAWWYSSAPHAAPDAPRFPRGFDAVAAHWPGAEPLSLEIVLGGGPTTVGLLGRR